MATAGRHADAESVRGVMSSPRPKPSTKLLDAMIEEATVDAYNDEEQITGLFTMLEEHLVLPFDTDMLGITVTVTKLDLTAGNEIVVICRRDAHKQAIQRHHRRGVLRPPTDPDSAITAREMLIREGVRLDTAGRALQQDRFVAADWPECAPSSGGLRHRAVLRPAISSDP